MTRSYLAATATVILALLISCSDASAQYRGPVGPEAPAPLPTIPNLTAPLPTLSNSAPIIGGQCQCSKQSLQEIGIVWRVKLHSRHTTRRAATRIALTSAKASRQT
jgi:hypothetical protein